LERNQKKGWVVGFLTSFIIRAGKDVIYILFILLNVIAVQQRSLSPYLTFYGAPIDWKVLFGEVFTDSLDTGGGLFLDLEIMSQKEAKGEREGGGSKYRHSTQPTCPPAIILKK
jgi:hypothetical protein